MKQLRYSIIFIIMFTLMISGCGGNRTWKKQQGVVLVHVGTNVLSLQVWSDRIIRVTYAASDSLLNRKSLIVDDKVKQKVNYEVTEENGYLTLKTSEVSLKVDLKTGELQFSDKTGKPLLTERKGGGKKLEEATISGSKTWHIRQQFEAAEDEALYGLGQHQDRLMNIKGYDIDLYQTNRRVVVPFLVSAKGYGILWDNYSFTRFGSLDSSKALPGDCLYNKKGVKGGLSASFFSDNMMKYPLAIAKGKDNNIPCMLPEGMENKIMSARWEGSLELPETGEYQFFDAGQSYFRLYIGDKLQINHWSSFLSQPDMARIHLEKGRRYAIRIEWEKSKPAEEMAFTWKQPSGKEPFTSLWSEAGRAIDYFYVSGKSMDEVIAGYRLLTGSASMMPKWGYGFWQCRERYKTAEEITGIVREFRKRKVPLDVIVQDWQYWRPGEWGSHGFDPSRYPDPKAMTDEIHRLNAHVMISVWAKFYTNSKNFEDLQKAGFLYPYNLKDSTRDWLDKVYTYYDAYNPSARKMYWDQINRLIYSKGFDAWWLDATEPEVKENTVPGEIAKRMNPNYYGTGAEFLNAYPRFTCQGVFEGQRLVSPDKRVSILTRSAFAGQQKFGAVTWSGDIVGRWEALKAQIPAGLNFCLSGIPYWTTDIGGFSVDYPGGNENEEYRELFTRWFQFGAFCPVFRVHGTNTPREIWFFGGEEHPAYRSQLKFIKLHYRLLPYIYSIAGKTTLEGYTPMRAMVMDFQTDPNVFNISDQYMFGPAILVNPVTDFKARERKVYLPATGWYDFWNGRFCQGGKDIQAPAPYESMPLFVKAGSVIPFGPELQYAMEKAGDVLDLFVYTGADGEFSLYDDEGVTNNYEKGQYLQIPLKWNNAEKSLTLGPAKGSYPGMPAERTFRIHLVSPENPEGYEKMGEPQNTIKFKGEQVKVLLK